MFFLINKFRILVINDRIHLCLSFAKRYLHYLVIVSNYHSELLLVINLSKNGFFHILSL